MKDEGGKMSEEIKEGDTCPECGSGQLSNDYDRDDEGEVLNAWIHCGDCGHDWTWADS